MTKANWKSVFFAALFGASVSGLLESGLNGAEATTQPAFRDETAGLVSPSSAATYFGSATTHTDHLSLGTPNEIKMLARALGAGRASDEEFADLVFEYVWSNIDTVPLYGLQKGALGAVIDQSGTAFDQAALMVALINEGDVQGSYASLAASYKAGTITLSGTQFEDWFGVTDAKAACQMLADGGIPATVNSAGACGGLSGSVTSVTMAHVWVEVVTSGGTYLYDPSFKTYDAVAGLSLATLRTAMGCSSGDCASAVESQLGGTATSLTGGSTTVNGLYDLSTSSLATKLTTYSDNLLDELRASYAEKSIEEIIGGRELDLDALPATVTSLSHVTSTDKTWSGTSGIPDQYRTRLRIEADGIDQNFFVDEIYGRMVSLVQTSLTGVSGCADRCRRTDLVVDDTVVDYDEVASTSGQTMTVTLTANHPYAAASGAYMDESLSKTVKIIPDSMTSSAEVKSVMAVIQGWGDVTYGLAGRFLNQIARSKRRYPYHDPSEELYGSNDPLQSMETARARQALAASWMSEVTDARRFDAQLKGYVVQHHHTLGLVFANDNGSDDETRFDAEPRVSVNDKAGSASAGEEAAYGLAAITAALEGGVVRRMSRATHVTSTHGLLGLANDTSHEFYLFTSLSEFQDVKSQLSDYAAARITAIEAYLSDGYDVLMPDDGKVDCLFGGSAVCIDGAGFIAVKSDGSETAHIAGFEDGSDVIALKGAGGTGDFSSGINAQISERNAMASGGAGGTDLSVGSQAFPLGLSFARSFSGGSATYHEGSAAAMGSDLGAGWSHNHRSSATFGGDGSVVYGHGSPFAATDTIAALITLGDFAGQSQSLEHLLGAAFTLNWWEEEAEENSITVSFGGSGAGYTKLADGSWYAGMGPAYALSLSAGRSLDTTATPFYTYKDVNLTLTSLSGHETLTFDNVEPSGTDNVWTLRLTDWDFPTGVGVDYTYTTVAGATHLTKVQNTLTRSLTLAYNATTGLLASVTSDDSRSVSYSYTMHDCVTAHLGLAELDTFTDAVGDHITYTYDELSDDATCVGVDETPSPDAYEDGPLTFGMASYETDEDTSYPALRTTFDALGRVISVKDAGNYETVYFTAAVGGERLVRAEVEDALGNITTTYRSRLSAVTIDAEGKETHSTYDRLGRLTAQSFPTGVSTSYAYMGLNASYAYDTRTNTTGVTVTPKSGSGLSAISRAMSWNDDFPVPDWQEDFEGNRTSYTYDSEGRVLTVTLPDDDANSSNNPVTTYTYNTSYGLPATVTNPEGTATATTYDAKANLTQVTFDTGGGNLNYVTTISYDAEGNQYQVDGPKAGTGDRVTFTYDDNRRVTLVQDSLGGKSAVVYNARGQKELLKAWTGTTWAETEYTYDARALPNQIDNPLNQASLVSYDALGRVEIVTNANGDKVRSYYDAMGRTTKVVTGYGLGTAIETVESTFSSTTGQLLSVKDGKDNETSYTYDGFGRVSTVTYEDASTESFTYDDNGRVLTSTTRKGDTITFTYTATGQVKTKSADDVQTHVYDIMGRLTSVTSNITGTPSNSFTYDAASRVLTATGWLGRTVSYTYDAQGNTTKLTHPDSYYVDYTYDALGRMTGIKENGASTFLAEYSYDLLGRRTDLERRNGADTSYTFDLASRLTEMSHSFEGSPALDYDYGYNAVGQMTSRTVSNEDFIWTPSANGTESATVNSMNELSVFNSNTITYDDNGNMTSDASQTYVYNKVNQMIGALVGSSTISYTYDGLGRRVVKDVDSTVTEFVHDGAHEIVEYDDSDTVLRRYIYGPGTDERVAMVEGATTLWYHTDHQGSVVAMTDSDGEIAETYTYDAYGKSDTIIGQPFRYTGRRLDPETGLYYYRARYYSPAMGRFMQVDPIGYAAGMNTHIYVGGDPVNSRDPSGMKDEQVDEPFPVPHVTEDPLIEEIVITEEQIQQVPGLADSVGDGVGSFVKSATFANVRDFSSYGFMRSESEASYSRTDAVEEITVTTDRPEDPRAKHSYIDIFGGVWFRWGWDGYWRGTSVPVYRGLYIPPSRSPFFPGAPGSSWAAPLVVEWLAVDSVFNLQNLDTDAAAKRCLMSMELLNTATNWAPLGETDGPSSKKKRGPGKILSIGKDAVALSILFSITVDICRKAGFRVNPRG